MIATVAPERKDFEAVKQIAETACRAAYGAGVRDTYNPVDLHCADVGFVQWIDGTSEWLVEVEEASPDCQNLPFYIESQLKEHGYVAQVRLTW